MYDVIRKCQGVRIVIEREKTNREIVYIVYTVVRVEFRETQNVRNRVSIGVLENVVRVLERWIYIHVFSMAFSTLERESNLEKNGSKSS